MSIKSHKLKEKDSFLVFDDSQDEGEAKTKTSASIGIQTNFSCDDASTNTNLSLQPDESTDAERRFYMEAVAYAQARIQEIRKWNEEGLARIAINKSETQRLREEYEELFVSLSSKLEDTPTTQETAS